ncbi:restriction endonuclease PLD domain-containing protein [Selenomonas ruminantium]|uniref:NgoFVII restriction endonuclease n=1 Tax=Selenomonas ruminantium TaxID=971 RepID=A0A1H3YVN6_SELRU|nr:restriction endonuclease PLD domain-containing protein [Selenomonas ruminantium]SEA15470.1 NgoFVII restriction endonuclease [Selenomonas ruminantium]
MLFYQDLEEIIFTRSQLLPEVDQFVVVSGYVGIQPISRLREMDIPSQVIYGMYGANGIGAPLHRSLLRLENELSNTDIYYSQLPVHSKCYAWLKNNKVIHALVGSANFSVNGLNTDYRETLAEATTDTYAPLKRYIDFVMANSLLCTDPNIVTGSRIQSAQRVQPDDNSNTDVNTYCLSLLDRSGNVPAGSGINWGFAPNGHNKPGDAYIKISTKAIRNRPNIFSPKQRTNSIFIPKGRPQKRQNDDVELIWDDGTVMRGLLEGSQIIDGNVYPKQISSFPEKNILGLYLRNRLGLMTLDRAVNIDDFNRYGRHTIEISRQNEGVYYLNFAPSR